MKESIKTEVVGKDENGCELEVLIDNDVLDFKIDGCLVFSGDWSENLSKLFERALDIWPLPITLEEK